MIITLYYYHLSYISKQTQKRKKNCFVFLIHIQTKFILRVHDKLQLAHDLNLN